MTEATIKDLTNNGRDYENNNDPNDKIKEIMDSDNKFNKDEMNTEDDTAFLDDTIDDEGKKQVIKSDNIKQKIKGELDEQKYDMNNRPISSNRCIHECLVIDQKKIFMRHI